MYSFWHNSILGRFDPVEHQLSLDFGKLAFDPTLTLQTFSHEQVHNTLFAMTEFGLATTEIYFQLPKMKHLNDGQRGAIIGALGQAQLFAQEGIASLVEMNELAIRVGKKKALSWADGHMPPDYRERLRRLEFVLSLSDRYKNEFINKSARIAMQTNIRQQIVSGDLLRNPDDMIAFLTVQENTPDYRLSRLAEATKVHSYLCTKSEEEICGIANIVPCADVPKSDVVSFVNYLLSFTDVPDRVTEDQIGDVQPHEKIMAEAAEKMLIGNLNLGLSEGIPLWTVNDMQHHKREIEVVVPMLHTTKMRHRQELEMMAGKRLDGCLISFCRTPEKYLFLSDLPELVATINDFADKTLLVKPDYFLPGHPDIRGLPSARIPNVVIYNNMDDLKHSFKVENYIDRKSSKMPYFLAQAFDKSPIMTLAIIDREGVLHMVNTFGDNIILNFINEYTKYFEMPEPVKFPVDPVHFNNALSTWMRISWNIDWFASMTRGNAIIIR